jgi:hypothetical protein
MNYTETALPQKVDIDGLTEAYEAKAVRYWALSDSGERLPG